MVKFCLQCKNAFWGGKFCPKCEGEVLLLDAAEPDNQKYLGDLNIDVRARADDILDVDATTQSIFRKDNAFC